MAETSTMLPAQEDALEAALQPLSFEEAVEQGLSEVTVVFVATEIRESRSRAGATFLHGRVQDESGGFTKVLNVWPMSRKQLRQIYKACQKDPLTCFELVGTPTIRQTTGNPIYALNNAVISKEIMRDLAQAPKVQTRALSAEELKARREAMPVVDVTAEGYMPAASVSSMANTLDETDI